MRREFTSWTTVTLAALRCPGNALTLLMSTAPSNGQRADSETERTPRAGTLPLHKHPTGRSYSDFMLIARTKLKSR